HGPRHTPGRYAPSEGRPSRRRRSTAQTDVHTDQPVRENGPRHRGHDDTFGGTAAGVVLAVIVSPIPRKEGVNGQGAARWLSRTKPQYPAREPRPRAAKP